MKLCKDCFRHQQVKIHMRESWFYSHRCSALVGTPHPVTGDTIVDTAECLDIRLGPCGLEEAKWFVEQDNSQSS
jgi:hypothetical protein